MTVIKTSICFISNMDGTYTPCTLNGYIRIRVEWYRIRLLENIN